MGHTGMLPTRPMSYVTTDHSKCDSTMSKKKQLCGYYVVVVSFGIVKRFHAHETTPYHTTPHGKPGTTTDICCPAAGGTDSVNMGSKLQQARAIPTRMKKSMRRKRAPG